MKAPRSQTQLFVALLLSLAGCGCTSQPLPAALPSSDPSGSASSEGSTVRNPTAELPLPKTDACPHPLFLEHVTAIEGPAVVVEAHSGSYQLVVTRVEPASNVKLRPGARRARYHLELRREGKKLRQFVVGNDADPGAPPSVAAGLDGEFLISWPDRSKNAPGVGSSAGSYTVLDEERFARLTPETERLDAGFVSEVNAPSNSAATADTQAASFPERRYRQLQLGFWDGRFWAVTDDRNGLTLWPLDVAGQLDAPRSIDKNGHWPQLFVSKAGPAALIYLQNQPQEGAPVWVPPLPVVLEFRGGSVFGASLAAPKDFSPLALRGDSGSWWLLGSHAAEWPAGDYRNFFYGDQDTQRARFFRFSSLNSNIVLPIEEPPPLLENVEVLETRLARVWELDDARVEGAEEFSGTFSREQDRFAFRVTARCRTPSIAACEGKVVSRTMGGVGKLPFQGGFLQLNERNSEFFLERVDERGSVVWSQTTDYVEDLHLSADSSRLFAVRSYGWVKAFSTKDGRELFSVRLRGSGPCLTETEQGVVVGYHDQDSYTFELLDENGAATPVLELRGQYYQCVIAPWSRGILIATVYDNEPGANLGERVRKYERMNPQYPPVPQC